MSQAQQRDYAFNESYGYARDRLMYQDCARRLAEIMKSHYPARTKSFAATAAARGADAQKIREVAAGMGVPLPDMQPGRYPRLLGAMVEELPMERDGDREAVYRRSMDYLDGEIAKLDRKFIAAGFQNPLLDYAQTKVTPAR
jgi:hypothetical protein